jgi:uncharacterized protein
VDEGAKKRIRSECIGLLREVGSDEAVVEHCIAVAELALEIALYHNHSEGHAHDSVDEKLVFKGALLHDIGRVRSHGVEHGFMGGEVARALGLDEKVVRIIQRHVGAGITAEEAREVGLPPVTFIPETMEEKIVAHADNLMDGWRRTSIEHAIANLKEKLGEAHPSINRIIRLHEEVMGKSGKP